MSDRTEHIEKFVLGEMTIAEKEAFEAEMQSDAHLRETVSRMNIIHAALEQSIEDDLREQLTRLKLRQERASLPKSPSLFSRQIVLKRWAAAASLLLFVSFGLWLVLGKSDGALTRFSEQHYIHYDYAQLRGAYNEARDFPFDLQSGDFDKSAATQWFIQWLEKHPKDFEARYVLADIYYQMGLLKKAKEQLVQIIADDSILWEEKAEWNYILLSVHEPSDLLAKSTLESIMDNPSHSYHNQAKALYSLQKQ